MAGLLHCGKRAGSICSNNLAMALWQTTTKFRAAHGGPYVCTAVPVIPGAIVDSDGELNEELGANSRVVRLTGLLLGLELCALIRSRRNVAFRNPAFFVIEFGRAWDQDSECT